VIAPNAERPTAAQIADARRQAGIAMDEMADAIMFGEDRGPVDAAFAELLVLLGLCAPELIDRVTRARRLAASIHQEPRESATDELRCLAVQVAS
jgi:hypothetical protein